MSSIMNIDNHNFKTAYDADELMNGYLEHDPNHAESFGGPLLNSEFHNTHLPTVNLDSSGSEEDNAWLASASVILVLIFIAGIFLNLS